MLRFSWSMFEFKRTCMKLYDWLVLVDLVDVTWVFAIFYCACDCGRCLVHSFRGWWMEERQNLMMTLITPFISSRRVIRQLSMFSQKWSNSIENVTLFRSGWKHRSGPLALVDLRVSPQGIPAEYYRWWDRTISSTEGHLLDCSHEVAAPDGC